MAALGKARLRPRAGANHAPCPAVLNAEGARILDSRARIGQRLPKQVGYKNPAMHVSKVRDCAACTPPPSAKKALEPTPLRCARSSISSWAASITVSPARTLMVFE